MDRFYLALAADIAADRMREAATWRLADEARRNRHRNGVVDRLRALVAGRARQTTAAPAFVAERCDAA